MQLNSLLLDQPVAGSFRGGSCGDDVPIVKALPERTGTFTIQEYSDTKTFFRPNAEHPHVAFWLAIPAANVLRADILMVECTKARSSSRSSTA